MRLNTLSSELRFDFPLPIPTSRRSRLIARWFGLTNRPDAQETSSTSEITFDVSRLVPLPGQIVLISGASGSGKSSLLRSIKRQIALKRQAEIIDLSDVDLPDRPVVDCFKGTRFRVVLELLSRVGLAEAWTYLRTPRELSEGQRWRLRLALGMANASAPKVLIADEFAAVLDRVTASVIAHSLRRVVTAESGIAAVVATSHNDLLHALKPDMEVECDFGKVRVVH